MKLMTFNIWNYTKPWPQRRALIAAIIDGERPDVVALQETRHDPRYEGGRGQGDQLAQSTGYHPTWAQGQVYWPFPRVNEGLTILTPRPPLRSVVRELTKQRGDRRDENQRVCVGVVLQVDGREVHVYDSHFSLSPEARLTNAQEAFQFIRETSGEAPSFLMGDLNALPETAPIRFLTGVDEIGGERGDFVDCWVQARPDDLGWTYASFKPDHRIDYVLARNLGGRIREAHLVGMDSVDGVYPSDHMGVVVEIDFPA
jgi:endonuclease/exonuclease/phosphatase family metal-dependent hydrolase